MEIKLNELPVEHPLRNKPLVGMFYYSKGSLAKNEVRSSFGIAKIIQGGFCKAQYYVPDLVRAIEQALKEKNHV